MTRTEIVQVTSETNSNIVTHLSTDGFTVNQYTDPTEYNSESAAQKILEDLYEGSWEIVYAQGYDNVTEYELELQPSDA